MGRIFITTSSTTYEEFGSEVGISSDSNNSLKNGSDGGLYVEDLKPLIVEANDRLEAL